MRHVNKIKWNENENLISDKKNQSMTVSKPDLT